MALAFNAVKGIKNPFKGETKKMTNAKLKILSAALMMSAVFGFSSISSAETEKSAEAALSIMSDYMWRGFNLGDKGVVQPAQGLAYGGFGANLWSNYDMDREELNETDMTLNYAFSVENFGFEAGYIYYGLDGSDDTQEIYLSAGYDTLLSPSLAVYYDFDRGNGAYVEASIGHSFEFENGISLGLGALASLNLESKYSIGGYRGFHHADLFVSLSVPVGKDFSIEPMAAYSFALSAEAEDSIEAVSADGRSGHFYGGITASLRL